MSYIISFVLGYVFGNFQSSYIIAKSFKSIDIREYGSGNAGSTNALRVMGKKFGLLTFAGDLLKAVLAVVVARLIFDSQVLGLLAGFGTVIGHNWPVVLKFKGGKGIAATLGTILAFDLPIGLVIWAVVAAVIFSTKYVSVGSMLLVTLFPIAVAVFYPGNVQALVIALILMVMGLYQHRANIGRLLKGSENKIGQKQSSEATEK